MRRAKPDEGVGRVSGCSRRRRDADIGDREYRGSRDPFHRRRSANLRGSRPIAHDGPDPLRGRGRSHGAQAAAVVHPQRDSRRLPHRARASWPAAES